MRGRSGRPCIQRSKSLGGRLLLSLAREMQATSSDEQEFDVFVNPDFGGEDLESFADAFAGWAPEEEASRRFNQSDCRELLKSIDHDDKCAEVFVNVKPVSSFAILLQSAFARMTSHADLFTI